MIFALEGNFAYSFLLGILAAVNPCGFVLLPTYLLFFLGMREETDLGTSERIRRALVVSSGVSVGFLGVFLVIGIISRLFTQWIELNAKYASFLIGVALLIAGLRMITGWIPKFAMPQIGGGQNRNFRAMTIYGVAYAVASIGCTIGFLTTAVFGSIAVNGFVSGVISIVLYGLGMAMLVMALTVSLAFAKTGLITMIKSRMRIVERFGAVLVTFTGFYLIWYWFAAISERSSTVFVSKVENYQTKVVSWIQNQGAIPLAILLSLVLVVAISLGTRNREKIQ
jgi:cytochrome c biogenesis protein CcdA